MIHISTCYMFNEIIWWVDKLKWLQNEIYNNKFKVVHTDFIWKL